MIAPTREPIIRYTGWRVWSRGQELTDPVQNHQQVDFYEMWTWAPLKWSAPAVLLAQGEWQQRTFWIVWDLRADSTIFWTRDFDMRVRTTSTARTTRVGLQAPGELPFYRQSVPVSDGPGWRWAHVPPASNVFDNFEVATMYCIHKCSI